MLSFSWDAGYEATPTSGLSRNSLDNDLRRIHAGIRERMEREHNFGANTDEDDGTHIPGKTTVVLKDSTVVRNALSDVQTGACYLLDDGTNMYFEVWTGAAWLRISDNDHDALAGLTDDDHGEMYWLGTSVVTDAAAILDMGGEHLSTAAVPTLATRVVDHIDDIHDITTIAAIKAQDIIQDKVTSATQQSFTGTVAGSGYVGCALASNITAMLSITLECTDGADGDLELGIMPYTYPNSYVIHNARITAKDYRLHLRYCT